MRRGVFGLALAGAVQLAVLASGAAAYVAEGPVFPQLGGAAATLARQTELGPVALALQRALGALDRSTVNAAHDADGILAFYEERRFLPVWVTPDGLTARAIAIVARLAEADLDGLDPAAYATPALNFGAGATAEAIAAADLRLTRAVAAYIREAYAGRLDPRTVSPNIDIRPHLPDTHAALADVATALSPVGALESYNPTHAGYLALRDELLRLRVEARAEAQIRIVVPAGPTLRPGDVDERVTLLRARLELSAPSEKPAIYDDNLVSAVRAFQTTAGLVVDGIVGPSTLNALNGPDVDPVSEVIANMERWRWMPGDLGPYYVQVNVPEFMVRIIDNGEPVHETRVVVGQPANQTPIFSDRIEHIIVNPYWNVPASIAANELLPLIRRDPGYFVRNGFDVMYNPGGRSYAVDPFRVNWARVEPGQVAFRQRPGHANALGQIKFMFPNAHNVYLHDTPAKDLFRRDARAFSHGCVRVMNPIEFANALLSKEPDWNAERLPELFGDTERQVNLARSIPVHITYFTAIVTEGILVFRPDIYGHSAAVIQALHLAGADLVAAAAPGTAADLGP